MAPRHVKIEPFCEWVYPSCSRDNESTREWESVNEGNRQAWRQACFFSNDSYSFIRFSGVYCSCISENIGRLGLFIVEDIFWHNKDSFLILPELSFTFSVNFFKGEIYLQKLLLIISTWYHEYIEKLKLLNLVFFLSKSY